MKRPLFTTLAIFAIPALLLCVAFPSAYGTQPITQNLTLYIGYYFDGNVDDAVQRQAQRKEAEYLEARNIANQACRNETRRECLRQNELVFRKRISTVRGIKFLLKRETGDKSLVPMFTLDASTVTAPGLDVRFEQLPQADQYVSTGVYLRMTWRDNIGGQAVGGLLRFSAYRVSDNSPIDFPLRAEVMDLYSNE
jgi:hypothetical protein